MAGVLLVVTMLVGGFWMPASAEDALLADAAPGGHATSLALLALAAAALLAAGAMVLRGVRVRR